MSPTRPRWQQDWILILQWFLLSRLALAGVGVLARIFFMPYVGDHYVWVYSDSVLLDIWGVWDSGWYLSVAEHGYESVSTAHPDVMSLPHWGNYAFFPLYPALIALVNPIFQDYFVSALVVSNVAFLASCYLLLRVVEHRTDAETARRALRFLFVFPATFIFSGAFSESVCFLSMLACIAWADRGAHARAGVAGFCLTLARPVGLFLAVPLAWAWWRGGAGREGRPLFHPRVLFLAGIPLGLLAWLALNQIQTGDPMAFLVVQSSHWGSGFHNPLANILEWLQEARPKHSVNGVFAVVQFAVMLRLLVQRRTDWFLLAFLFWVVPIGGGGQSPGVLRYAILVFPYYVLLAEAGRDPRVERALLVGFAIFQGFLMTTWAVGLNLII